MNHSKTIINHIIDENIIEAKKIVTSLISQKAKVHLDDQKRNIAAEMFGGCKTCNEPTLEEGNNEQLTEGLTDIIQIAVTSILPVTMGAIGLLMIELLSDGSGPYSGSISLYQNLKKKWKARILGGKLSADDAQTFIAEYEALIADLPKGERNFMKSSLNKLQAAAKDKDKALMGKIATEVKNYVSTRKESIEEGSAEEYKAFFKSALKKFGVSSPAELESDAERKKFFDYVDKNWKGEQAENVEEATKVSPQEDEFLTDLTKVQIAAISPLLKSKDTNKLKAYLVSQKIVDKDFNDIQGYKMDRDVLSVLQRSFKDYHE
jgi:hypothetical protein